MIDAVKTAFKERLDKNDWIDDTTRQASKDKVDAITKMVAYPDEISNTTYLNDLYAEVSGPRFVSRLSERVNWKIELTNEKCGISHDLAAYWVWVFSDDWVHYWKALMMPHTYSDDLRRRIVWQQ